MGGRGRRILLVVVSLLLVFTLFIGALAYSLRGVYAQPKPYVALVELSGVIDYERPLLGGAITPGDARSVFDIVKRDPFAKAVVLIVNSPGGTAASFEVYELVRELSREKVVVAYVTGYGTSGGYLIVLPADEIVAQPAAFVGSVGAIAVIVSYKGLMDKLGINATTVKSGDLKDIGNPYREATSDDIEAVRRLINGIAGVFAEKVREHRGDKIRDYREILRAGVYTGVEAERLGLVDMVGTLEDAIRRARELAGLPGDAPALWVERRVSLIDILLGRTSITTPMGGREPLAVEVLLMWPIPAELAGKTLLVVSSGG